VPNLKKFVKKAKKAKKASRGAPSRQSKAVIKVGVFSASSHGYGFVVTADEGESDIFIPASKVNGALHSDTVECLVKSKADNTRPEGVITEVVSRGTPLLAGTFCAGGNIKALQAKIPYTFPVSPSVIKRMGLAEGHRVMFSVSVDGHVKVHEIFGHKNDPGSDILSLIHQYAVPYVFSEEALEEAGKLPYSVSDDDILSSGRADYRDQHIITIDGADTKDYDDAISLEILPDGSFALGVHIADVSHYVVPGSALDESARARGTSIYLADRVIPMLPHKLSNGICSLNPGEDRLTLSCIMKIDQQGDVLSHKLRESVIHSKERLVYDDVALQLENGTAPQYLQDMHKLAEILRKKRMSRGALEFNFSEAKVTVDENGFPTAIEARKSNSATSLIEEFMIVCNETVAEHSKNDAFVFRTHDSPDLDKMYQLSAYAQNLGYNLPVSERGISAKALQKLLDKVQGTPEAAALEPVVLRSLKQARYTAENIGHFGLASKFYCHFTSPIRRYPDLLVHRSIKYGLKKRGLTDLCDHCSKTERNAEELEREVLQLKKVQFMRDKVGQSFDAIVSGVVSWGIFVKLPNTVEGLVPMDLLKGDEYVFVEKQMAVFGVRSKNRIRLGDPITVTLSRVDEEERKLVFAPSE